MSTRTPITVTYFYTFNSQKSHFITLAANLLMFTSPFRMHELVTISVLMIHTRTRGIPMIGSTVMVHVAPGKWLLHVIMVFVVPVWHMIQKSPVSVQIIWICKTAIIHVRRIPNVNYGQKKVSHSRFQVDEFIRRYILVYIVYMVHSY